MPVLLLRRRLREGDAAGRGGGGGRGDESELGYNNSYLLYNMFFFKFKVDDLINMTHVTASSYRNVA